MEARGQQKLHELGGLGGGLPGVCRPPGASHLRSVTVFELIDYHQQAFVGGSYRLLG